MCSSIDDLRDGIDKVDKEIVQLLNRRAELVKGIGQLKVDSGAQIYVPDRERQVYKRVTRYAEGGLLSAESVREIYREIMSASLALEKHLRVAYLGPAGTFSHEAALKKFGRSVEFVPSRSFEDIFVDMVRKEIDYGVVPVENSTDGGITDTLDLFVEYDVCVCGELLLPVRQNLLSRATREKIKVIYSKPQIFAQCKGWLNRMMPDVELREMPSSAAAAEHAANDPQGAAIGSEGAASIYGLNILSASIEDRHDNVTRFFVLGPEWSKPTDADKTALCFSVRDEVGALCHILKSFEGDGINLTKIESRPSKRKAWDYLFFVDVEGHVDDACVRQALDAVKAKSVFFKVLGSFPRAEPMERE